MQERCFIRAIDTRDGQTTAQQLMKFQFLEVTSDKKVDIT